MIETGRINTLEVLREKPQGIYLGSEGEEVLLPRAQVPGRVRIGDSLKVFVYRDSEDRRVATRRRPHAMVGDFACLRVVSVGAHGAFLDWGLEKDLLVPHPLQHRPMREGEDYVVAVMLDEGSDRVVASSQLGELLDYEVGGLEVGTQVQALVYDFNDIGALVIVEDRYSGLIYRNESYRELAIGDGLEGWIKKVRDDNKLDISLRPPGYQAATALQGQILERLDAAGGFLPLHDKSPPAEIAAAFAVSKRVFKQAIGGLFKAGEIRIEADGIRRPG